VNLALEVDLGLVGATGGGDVEGWLVATLIGPSNGGNEPGEGGVAGLTISVPLVNLIIGVVLLKPVSVLWHCGPGELGLGDMGLNILNEDLAALSKEVGEEGRGELGGGQANLNLAINAVGPDVKAKGMDEVVEGIRVNAVWEGAQEHLVARVVLSATISLGHAQGASHEGQQRADKQGATHNSYYFKYDLCCGISSIFYYYLL
jgi:hypothetical protein